MFWMMHEKRFRHHCVIFRIAPVKATVVCRCPKSPSLPQASPDKDHGSAGPITTLAQLRSPQGTAVCPMPYPFSTGMTFTAGKTECPITGPMSRKMPFLTNTASLPRNPTPPPMPLFFSSWLPAQSRDLSTSPGVDGFSCCLQPLSEAHGHICLSHTFLLLLTDLISFQPVLFFFCSIVKLQIVTLDQNFIASNETVSQERRNLNKSENAVGCFHDFWISAWPS